MADKNKLSMIITMTTQKKWLSITDYSNITQLSVSTIRRRIKNRKVIFKKQNGKFFILGESQQFQAKATNLSKLGELEVENQRLKELIAEQDMLIKLYEAKLTKKQDKTLSSQQIWGSYSPEANQ